MRVTIESDEDTCIRKGMEYGLMIPSGTLHDGFCFAFERKDVVFQTL